MSGAVTSVTNQGFTGNNIIDGLLSGLKWNASYITYSTPDSAADYQVGYGYDHDGDTAVNIYDGFAQLNASQIIAYQSALDSTRYGGYAPAGGVFSVEGFTNLDIAYLTPGSGAGTIRVANATDETIVAPPHPTAHAGYAFNLDQGYYAGDVFLNGNSASVVAPAPGNHGWHTMLHEVGHALGLKHGHQTNNVLGSVTLPSAMDSIEYSVMTYRSYVGDSPGYDYETWGAPQTYMMLDILALQTMYGADYSVNMGNTTYTWDPSTGTTYIDGQVAIDPGDNRIFATIWDGGGSDTYDLSNYTYSLDINLNPGEFSTFSDDQLAYLGSGHSARGNIANAMLFSGNTASLIENANGGSGNDDIVGNVANNLIYGNDGFDLLYGMDGSDALYGGNGNDFLDGGSGYDIMVGGQGDDTYYVDNVSDTVSEVAGGGYDVLNTSVNFSLSSTSSIEVMTGMGTGNINLTGNSSIQTIQGTSGNNRISGGDGNDTLIGFGGSDVFVFSVAPSASNRDTITDFSRLNDLIEMSRSVFTTLNAGSSLNASAFRIGTGALDSDDRVLYNSATGGLFYDSDGNGAALQVQFATIGTGLAMASSNFVLVA